MNFQTQSENPEIPSTATATSNAPLPASVSPNTLLTRRTSDVAARLQNLRNLLNNDRQRSPEQRQAMEALDREMREMSAEPISARLDRRRRGLESQIRDYETQPLEAVSATLPSPSSLMRARRRATRPSERLQRHRDRLNQTAMARQEAEPSRAPTYYPPVPRIGSPDVATREYMGEAQVNRENRWRASKRRKLEVDDNNRATPAFRYGYKGQVVSGKLKMQIISNDGGVHTESNGESSCPNNVLDDDPTVYCTKSNHCNMVLGHLGDMPFSLSKVVIKAPQTGFDAPIQEGMIFVAMDDDNLLARTSNYQIQYTPKRHRHRHRRPERSQIRLGPTLEYFNSVRSPLRTLDRPASVVEPISLQDWILATISPPHPPQSNSITPMTTDFHRPADQSDAPSLVPGFHVTMNFDDAANDDEDNVRPGHWHTDGSFGNQNQDRDYEQADVARLLALQDHYAPQYAHHTSDENEDGESSESDSSDDEHLLEMIHSRDANYHRMSAADQRTANEAYMLEFREWRRQRRSRDGENWWSTVAREPIRHRRTEPSHIQVATAPNNIPTSNGLATLAQASIGSVPTSTTTSDILAPHARFFIRRDKSSVSVKFDPPV